MRSFLRLLIPGVVLLGATFFTIHASFEYTAQLDRDRSAAFYLEGCSDSYQKVFFVVGLESSAPDAYRFNSEILREFCEANYKAIKEGQAKPAKPYESEYTQ